MYDHSVQGTNDLQPYSGVKLDGPNDAVVLRPLLNKPYGIVISHGINPILNRLDPYWGSIWAATEAVANYVAVGGNYKDASLINNYIWPFPDEESLWSLDRAVDAVVDFMKTLKIPVISGKDSLSSTYRASRQAGREKVTTVIKIPPVLCISMFGKIPNAAKTITSDFKKEGSTVCLVGRMDFEAMGGSTYFDSHRILGSNVPKVDLRILPKVLGALHKGIVRNKILSCHDVSEGGLITTIFEMCVGGDMGATIDVFHITSKARTDYILFNETAGCFVVEIEDEKIAHSLFKKVPYIILGRTKKEPTITARWKKKELFDANLRDLKRSWKAPMSIIFG